MRTILKQVKKFLEYIPFKSAIILALVLLAFKEFFPFSHFPMYSNLPPKTSYYYLTDENDEIIPQGLVFGVYSARMSKIFYSELRKEIAKGHKDSPQLREEIGRRVIQHMIEVMPEWNKDRLKAKEIRLYRVEVARTEAKLLRNSILVAVYNNTNINQ